jgi:hypothetical protein
VVVEVVPVAEPAGMFVPDGVLDPGVITPVDAVSVTVG